MGNTRVYNEYFKWLCENIDDGDFNECRYSRLLNILHDIDFIIPMNIPTIENDTNRISNGKNLRWHFVCEGGSRQILSMRKPCSVLELLIGLSDDFESIVDDALDGDIFWQMLDNMDLLGMTNDNIDIERIEEAIETFMYRRYSNDGSNGGIFIIPRYHRDLTTMELWNQMCLYIDEMI